MLQRDSATHCYMYRGMKLDFHKGNETCEQWSRLDVGDIVGTPALTSASLCMLPAASFLDYPEHKDQDHKEPTQCGQCCKRKSGTAYDGIWVRACGM